MRLICCKKAGGLSGEYYGHISEGTSQVDLWDGETWTHGIVLRPQVSKGRGEGMGENREGWWLQGPKNSRCKTAEHSVLRAWHVGGSG